jgi:hypothetical protein
LENKILTMDGDIHERGATRIAKKEHDKERRCRGKIHKKRLHILFDQNSKAFQGWEAVVEPWSLTTCERFIEWCHIGKAFPPSRHGIHRKHNVGNLKYYTWPKFKERCIQVHQFLYDEPNVKSNSITLSILRMVYAEIALEKKVDWMTMRASSISKILVPSTQDIPRERKFEGGGLGRMMDHAVISTEEVEWSCTSSDDDQTGCAPEVRCEKESGIKCAWLNSTLMDMVAQDEEHKNELQVDIAKEIHGEDLLRNPPPHRVHWRTVPFQRKSCLCLAVRR